MMRNERSGESSDTLHSRHTSESQDHFIKILKERHEGMSVEEIHEAMTILGSRDISLPPLIEVPNNTSTYAATHHARIQALSEATGRSREEIITAALTLYELGLKAQQHNKKFGVVEPDQPLITEVGSL